jgi:dynactin complex subunit
MKRCDRYKNQADCEQANGLPPGTLRKANKLGCPGIQGSYINYDLVAPWLESHQADLEAVEDNSTLHDQKMLAEIRYKEQMLKNKEQELRNLQIKEEQLRNERIKELAADVKTLHANLHREFRKMLTDLPLQQVGLTPAQVQESNLKALNNLCSRIGLTDEQGSIREF